MKWVVSRDKWQFLLHRIRERLWIKPLLICAVSVIAVFGAKVSDNLPLAHLSPDVSSGSVESLLSIMAASMLAIATFAVASMVSAYSSASTTATPRSFPLVIADDVSQNALSTFVGAFIFSIVALMSMKNGYFEIAGRFTLFSMTVAVLGFVVFTFVRWTDRIARLGRLGATVEQVESAAATAMLRRRKAMALGGLARNPQAAAVGGKAVFASEVGYVQQIDMQVLQEFAQNIGGRVVVDALPGTFAMPGNPLAHVIHGPEARGDADLKQVASAFTIGRDRVFDHDPRLGLIVLSEIAGRALSPAVNDPGTAIGILGTLVRLFTLWAQHDDNLAVQPVEFDRVVVPVLQMDDLFDDAFTAIARDGAGAVEVGVRLQKSLRSLASAGDDVMRVAAMRHAQRALASAEQALSLPHEVDAIRALAQSVGLPLATDGSH
mgnify:CR=1 FL=1|jgi:uncharacterized membrane protein